MVAFREVGDGLAHFLDDAGALMAKHERQRQRDRAGDRREIGMAHAAGAELYHHLAALGRIDADLFNADGLVVFAADDGARLA